MSQFKVQLSNGLYHSAIMIEEVSQRHSQARTCQDMCPGNKGDFHKALISSPKISGALPLKVAWLKEVSTVFLHAMICSSVQQCLHALVHCTAILQHDGTVKGGDFLLLRECIDVHTTVVEHVLQAFMVAILCSYVKSSKPLKKRTPFSSTNNL